MSKRLSLRSVLLLAASGLVGVALAQVGGCGGSNRRGPGNSSDLAGADLTPPPDLTTCQNLACNIQACPGGGTTSISGSVYDPAGTSVLYNVSVYIPNAPLAAIPDGIDVMTCTACPAPLSGSPLVTALTDSHGRFKLDNVPVGLDIPLVIQTGKFRRAITIPQVNPCVDNPVGAKDAAGAETLTRLPRNQSEGHIPLIAITTGGCEGLECVVRAYGFSDSEFTTSTGTGRIHLYTGRSGGKAVGGSGDQTEAYKFWGSDNIYKYDMILNSCECSPHPRDSHGPGYTNMKNYLDHGGRLFTSDFQYNWFTDLQAPADFKATAKWSPNQSAASYAAPFFVDTSFPKGMALNEWLQFEFAGAMPPPTGQIKIDSLFYNAGAVNPGTTRWIYASQSGVAVPSTATTYTTKYMSFNTPVSADPTTTQCGRAVFADIHVSSNEHASTFPAGCETVTKSQQVTAFEFLFFDIGSCVQDDSKPIEPPPVL